MKTLNERELHLQASKLLYPTSKTIVKMVEAGLIPDYDLTDYQPDYSNGVPLLSRNEDLTKTNPTEPKNYEERNDHGFHSRTYHGNYEPTSPDYETEASRKSVVRLTAHVYDYETNDYHRQVVDPVVKNYLVEEFSELTVATLLTHPLTKQAEEPTQEETNPSAIPPLEWDGVYDPAPSNECHLVHSRPVSFTLAKFAQTEQPVDPYYEALAMAQRRSEDLARVAKVKRTSTTVGKKPKPPKYQRRATPKPPSKA